MDATTYRNRRQSLRAHCPDWTFVIPGNALHTNIDAMPRPNATLRYLTGHDEPGAILIWAPGGEPILYAPVPDANQAKWFGGRSSHDHIAERAGLRDVRPVALFDGELTSHLRQGRITGFRLGVHAQLDTKVLESLSSLADRRDGKALRPIHDPGAPIGRMRLRKDEAELVALRRAAEVTAAAHRAIVAGARVGDSGLGLAGRFESSCRELGSRRTAYAPIVARSDEATCLHPTPSTLALVADDYLLIDAGAEVDGYASDLTRTWPLTSLTDARARLYQVVLDAQLAALDAIVLGTTLGAIHQTAKARLALGIESLGITAPLDSLFPHQTSHWIGLEVHDGCPQEELGVPVTLDVGMTFTIEPGIYIDRDCEGAPEALRGVGIRIEDTVAITASGVEVLTKAMPKSLEEIARIRRHG